MWQRIQQTVFAHSFTVHYVHWLYKFACTHLRAQERNVINYSRISPGTAERDATFTTFMKKIYYQTGLATLSALKLNY